MTLGAREHCLRAECMDAAVCREYGYGHASMDMDESAGRVWKV